MDRLQLHSVLTSILERVYFQPPPSVQMQYPCIVYHRDTGDTRFAGNVPYSYSQKYQVTLISRDPDDSAFKKVAALPMCVHNRTFSADNLNHDVFNLYT